MRSAETAFPVAAPVNPASLLRILAAYRACAGGAPFFDFLQGDAMPLELIFQKIPQPAEAPLAHPLVVVPAAFLFPYALRVADVDLWGSDIFTNSFSADIASSTDVITPALRNG